MKKQLLLLVMMLLPMVASADGVGHNAKAKKSVEWIENIENGDASKTWAEMGLADVKFDDMDNNYKICAWGKEREVNMNAGGVWDPFPATIEEVDGNKVFVVHGKAATTEGDASAWDNQFWIQSPKEWKAGTQLKIHFRYKASKNVKVNTSSHHQTPSDYLAWHSIGDINFTTEWQEFNGTLNIANDMAGTWSIAFHLNPNNKDAIDFYFDDLSWKHLKVDEGYFVAGCNTFNGTEYDLENAIQFTYDEAEGLWTATVGTKDAYVDQIMIFTVLDDDATFKGVTLKPASAITNDPDNWLDYTESSLAKLNLPDEGIWKIYLDENNKSMAFEMTEKGKICATPTIAYVDGKLKFSCETEGVTYKTSCTYDNTNSDVNSEFVPGGITTAHVSVYAAKEGYRNSGVATADVELCVGIKGDVNGDGDVSITDAVGVVNIILNNGAAAPAMEMPQEQNPEAVPE